MNDYFNTLQSLNPVLNDNHIELELPVILNANSCCLKLLIFYKEDHYLIAEDNHMFDEFNEEVEYYYNSYKKYCLEHDILFTLKLDKDHFYKIWPENYNILYAINGFIRMMINFDDYIIEQNLC